MVQSPSRYSAVLSCHSLRGTEKSREVWFITLLELLNFSSYLSMWSSAFGVRNLTLTPCNLGSKWNWLQEPKDIVLSTSSPGRYPYQLTRRPWHPPHRHVVRVAATTTLRWGQRCRRCWSSSGSTLCRNMLTLSLSICATKMKLSNFSDGCSFSLWPRLIRLCKNRNISPTRFLGLTYAFCDIFGYILI